MGNGRNGELGEWRGSSIGVGLGSDGEGWSVCSELNMWDEGLEVNRL